MRFPDWPIAEPVDLLRACLDEFKNQLTRDESEEEVAMESTRKVLWLQTGDGSKELLTQSVQISPDKVSPCLAATPMAIFSDVPSSAYLTINASVYRTLLVENNRGYPKEL